MNVNIYDNIIYFSIGNYNFGFLRLSYGELYNIIIDDTKISNIFNSNRTKLFVKIIKDFNKLNNDMIVSDYNTIIHIRNKKMYIYTNNNENINSVYGLKPNIIFDENDINIISKLINKYWETQYSFDKIIKDFTLYNRYNKLKRILKL